MAQSPKGEARQGDKMSMISRGGGRVLTGRIFRGTSYHEDPARRADFARAGV